MKNPLSRSIPALVLLALPTLAMAHVGAGTTTSFTAGLAHPLSGLDHLIALLAVGAWAALCGGRARWWLPAGFLGLMSAGAAWGAADLGMLGTEWLIAASVVALGLLIASRTRLHAPVVTALVASFALAHGHAHGAEMPVSASGLAYAAGFMLAASLLQGAGVAVGSWLAARSALFSRLAGGGVAAAGLALMSMSMG